MSNEAPTAVQYLTRALGFLFVTSVLGSNWEHPNPIETQASLILLVATIVSAGIESTWQKGGSQSRIGNPVTA